LECKYFGECGACIVYKDGYNSQLDNKIVLNKKRFEKYYSGEFYVASSPEQNYRFRSEFKLWHVDNEIHYAMNHKDKNGVVLIDECPQVNIYIFELMPKLLKVIKDKKIEFKLFGLDFLSSSSGEIVVSFLYHRKLDDAWEVLAKEISQELGIYIIGRSRKQKVIVGQDYIIEHLNVNGEVYRSKHIENSFTQPNARVNEKMIEWTQKDLLDTQSDLLELYCGAGNFTIPFAKKFNKILATEISKSSINAAKENMLLNSVTNIEFVRMSVEDFTQALDGVREFRRMKDIDLNSYDIKTIFVDPPRSGMGKESSEFASRYKNIIYISCNPETLLKDLDILSKTHKIVDMAIFDQFPYTHHVEMGVKLIKKV
jgi:tRNA (uracil-5-)-methyltransferase